MPILLKRAYESPEPGDGLRILVDRLWPRGAAKESAQIDLWLKEVAPSTALRQWFGHDPAKWGEFRERYGRELAANLAPFERLRQLGEQGSLTLVYGAREREHNHAVLLREWLTQPGAVGGS